MQDNLSDTVSVTKASEILGVSPDAIRKRLSRGTLQGIKHNREWRVIMPDDADASPSGGIPGHKAVSDSEALRMVAEYAAAAAMWQERARNLQEQNQILETQLLALQPGDPPENEATESPVSDDSDATGIRTHAETERATQSRWARFLAWFKPE